MGRERVCGMVVPGKGNRRSSYLRAEAEKFASGGEPHWSPSGLTAIMFAEAALRKGKSVTLEIHPEKGVVIKLGDSGVFDAA